LSYEEPERRYRENYRYRDRIGEGHFGSHEDMWTARGRRWWTAVH